MKYILLFLMCLSEQYVLGNSKAIPKTPATSPTGPVKLPMTKNVCTQQLGGTWKSGTLYGGSCTVLTEASCKRVPGGVWTSAQAKCNIQGPLGPEGNCITSGGVWLGSACACPSIAPLNKSTKKCTCTSPETYVYHPKQQSCILFQNRAQKRCLSSGGSIQPNETGDSVTCVFNNNDFPDKQ